MKKVIILFANLLYVVLHGQVKQETWHWLEEGHYHYSEFVWPTLSVMGIWPVSTGNYIVEGNIVNDSLVFELEHFSPREIPVLFDGTDTTESYYESTYDDTDTAIYEFESIKIPITRKYTELKYSKIEIRRVDNQDSMLRKSISYSCPFVFTNTIPILRFWTCLEEDDACTPWETEQKILHEIIRAK